MKDCRVCKSTSSAVIGPARGDITLRRCASCGLVFHNEFTDEARLREYYDHYYHEEDQAFSPITDERLQNLLSSFELYRDRNRVMDIGCGAGHFLKVAVEKGWNAYGTEIASGAFERLARLGVKTFHGELQSANYPAEFFDVIYCSEVAEHLLDPALLLKEAARITRKGGLLYLTTPNYNSLSRRLIGFDWRIFGKEHICYFTPRTLSRAIIEAGFSKVAVSTRNIDPHELRKIFKRSSSERSSSEPGAGFQAERTEALRQQLETRRWLKLAKSAANSFLSATATGDTIVAKAEK
jgi:SAM-dependent methyltransferase